jgi:REP element-mobilizing transposase RayT
VSKQYPDRKRIRLKGYDYSKPGNYFVTINTNKQIKCLSNIENDTVRLSEAEMIVKEKWNDLPNHYPNCELDKYVIMPNHFHGIIKIIKCSEGSAALPNNEKTKKISHGLPEIIRGFKTFTSKLINENIRPYPKFNWQKSYHDRIIRNERELINVRKYIINNPLNWEGDRNYRDDVGM